MLWWPYRKKGIPHSFQPKWKGPYTLVKLDETNCQIQIEDGKVKNVHLNQLKLVRKRSDQNTSYAHERMQDEDEPFIDLFDNLDLSINDGEVARLANDDDRWCGLDNRNVIASRTRSGILGEGVR